MIVTFCAFLVIIIIILIGVINQFKCYAPIVDKDVLIVIPIPFRTSDWWPTMRIPSQEPNTPESSCDSLNSSVVGIVAMVTHIQIQVLQIMVMEFTH